MLELQTDYNATSGSIRISYIDYMLLYRFHTIQRLIVSKGASSY